MIHRIKTVTWEVRSHSFITVLSESGKVIEQPRIHDWAKSFDIKRLIGHLNDVLGAISKLERQAAKEAKKQARKERQANENLPDEN